MCTVKQRIATEKKIARKIISLALAKGYSISVNDGEETLLHRSYDKSAILGAMFSTDEDYLIIHRPTVGTPRVGWIRMIYGNDGYDVVNNYSVSLEHEFMKEINDYCDKLAE